MASTDKYLAEQARRNRESRDAWSAFAAHRARVTQLLLDAAKGKHQPSLCLLGAGNCNDVDLRRLLEVYESIQMVDCDKDALRTAISRQGLAGRPAIHLHGNMNLLEAMPGEATTSTLNLDIAVDERLLALGRCDVVASLCVLSQLIEAATQLLGGDRQDPKTLELIQAVRRRHLALLVELVRKDGSGLLITDLVSSETVPQLQSLPESQLAPLLAQCIAARNFFTGLNPAVLLDLLQQDPWFAARIAVDPPLAPWVWDLGPRQYAVYGIRFTRLI
jgi:hypothetical protein